MEACQRLKLQLNTWRWGSGIQFTVICGRFLMIKVIFKILFPCLMLQKSSLHEYLCYVPVEASVMMMKKISSFETYVKLFDFYLKFSKKYKNKLRHGLKNTIKENCEVMASKTANVSERWRRWSKVLRRWLTLFSVNRCVCVFLLQMFNEIAC